MHRRFWHRGSKWRSRNSLAFLENRNDYGEEEGSSVRVLAVLADTMALLRRCRVNAALTIQLFSQLFHFINMWVFNRLIQNREYCAREWGRRIQERLSRVETWAEKQGLELAADCHLAKLNQAALLLLSPKSALEDAAHISSTCFKLNSVQLQYLLECYMPAADEHPVSAHLIRSVVEMAENTADGLLREEGRQIRLEEESNLRLPFLLPQDGYSCDIVRGTPSGLVDFVDPLQRRQLCRVTPQPTSSGLWTIYMGRDGGQRLSFGPRSPSVMSNAPSIVSPPRGEPEVCFQYWC